MKWTEQFNGGFMEKIRIQQGDLILVACPAVPSGAQRIKFDGIVLKGEGVNTHEIAPGECEMYELDGVLYLNVPSETTLIHQEHGNVTVAPGIYRRVIEREFDYEDMESRQTRD